MTTIMSYSNHCLQVTIPPPYYPNSPYDGHFQPLQRPETQRKRPKYTRSKTGCLTCRMKKIKCDETKPSCMRCTHGSRECKWPEGVPVRKKSTAKKDSDGRPSTAGSSGLSDASASPTRERTHTPPRRPQPDMNILPVPSQSPSDNFVHLHPMSSEHSTTRRETERGSGYMSRSSNPNILSVIPESLRYDTYLHHPHSSQPSRHTTSGSYRTLSQQPTSHWNPSSNHPSNPSEELNPHYHSGVHERTVPGHSPQYEHSNNRYQ